MQRTTIMLLPELKMRTQRVAQRDGVSLGDLIRRALDWLRGSRGTTPSAGKDPLFADEAVWTGDVPADLSQGHDRHLYADQEVSFTDCTSFVLMRKP